MSKIWLPHRTSVWKSNCGSELILVHLHVSVCCAYVKATDGAVLCCAEQLVEELKVGRKAHAGEEQVLVTATVPADSV